MATPHSQDTAGHSRACNLRSPLPPPPAELAQMRELQRPARSSAPITSHLVLGRGRGTRHRWTEGPGSTVDALGHRLRAVFPLSRTLLADDDPLSTTRHHHWTTIGAPSTAMLRAEKRPRRWQSTPTSPHPLPHLEGIVSRNWYTIAGCSSGFSHWTIDGEFSGGETAGWALASHCGRLTR